ncbi:YhgE/Pip domain-containing protein [Paenibacillus oceani]|uniref:ABC transporter permease n=1 Tax=Paenibacillus oceani TaxID=2772510 RepID=A0A927CEH1_9BACL|nr:ABC transporter permease [Paenibacillus oceani]MBD2864325.1 ABC transporter permease [Paenibacillus oceani]
MGNALKAFLQKTPTKIGIATAIMFQLIFSIAWMTGYDGVTDNTANLTIAVVNEDAGVGRQLAEQLGKQLPFQIVTESGLDAAKQKLEERNVQMVLHLPSTLSAQLQTPGQKTELQYWINESNPALIKSMMSSVAAGVTATLNKQAIAAGAQAVLAQMNVPAAQAQSTAQALSERVTSSIQYTNPVSGMSNQMVPMMLVLASYVGSMIMGMNLQQSSNLIGAQSGKWSKFAARAVLNSIAAVVTALVGTSLVLLLGGQSVQGFMTLWGFLTLCLLAFLFFSQLFLLLLGNAGMLLNIIALSAQLVSSGAMVPRELLNGFYRGLGDYLPATYAVEGNMNLLFGGPGAAGASWSLLLIVLVTAMLGLLVTALRKETAPAHGTVAAPKLAHSE